MNKCINCKKILIDYRSKRCHSCEIKRRYKEGIINNRGQNNPSHIDGRTLKKYYCIDCKITEISYPTWKYGKKRCKPCSSKYTSINLPHNFGKDGSNYIHGNGYTPYPIEFNDNLKIKILQRDNYICKKCSKIGKTIHHIDYNKDNCKKSNLITLCNKCNGNVNSDRDYWYAYFICLMEDR
jgi:hypothetical protein